MTLKIVDESGHAAGKFVGVYVELLHEDPNFLIDLSKKINKLLDPQNTIFVYDDKIKRFKAADSSVTKLADWVESANIQFTKSNWEMKTKVNCYLTLLPDNTVTVTPIPGIAVRTINDIISSISPNLKIRKI
jgi:hypothetical protein